MVMTRSKAKLMDKSDMVEMETKPKKSLFRIQIVPTTTSSNSNHSTTSSRMKPNEPSDSETSDSEVDNSSVYQEEYYDYIDSQTLSNKRLRKKVDKIVEYIRVKTPLLSMIVNAKIRKKHKAELFEMYIIYDNISLLSEEKAMYREKINNLLKVYENQYSSFLEHKQEIYELESNKSSTELCNLQLQIVQLNTSVENKKVIYNKYLELLEKKDDIDDEYFKLKSWIQFALKLPFDLVKEVDSGIDKCQYLQKVKTILDKELYGMNKVKEQLLLFIHSKLMNPHVKGCCLGLVGEPGVGKTSIARCLAKIMEIPFSQITFGGINSSDFLKGYDYTYVGSKPGEIVRCLSRMKYKNGILFMDEYEKISNNVDIISCLLHITDFSQNSEFRDNYLSELTIDLSSIWFIYSMNNLPEDQALKDRIFFIRVDGYQLKDQVQILCNYLLPKHLKNLNLEPECIQISESVAEYIIHKYGHQEKGVRTIEKQLKDLLHKISFLVTNQNQIQTSFNLPEKYLPIQYPFQVDTTVVDILLSVSSTETCNYMMNMYL